MKRFTLPMTVLVLLLITACRTEPKQETEKVNFKRTENEVIVRLEGEPDRINPILTTSNYGRQVVEQIGMYLLTFDPIEMEFLPQLAKDFPEETPITEGPLAGGMAFTFEIRDEAVWDNGTPVTGNDYAFTIKAGLHPMVQAPQIRPYLSPIKDISVDADNPKRFTVYSDMASQQAMEFIANTLTILPAYVYDPENALAQFPVSDFTDADKLAALAESNTVLKTFAEQFNAPETSRSPEMVKGCGAYELTEWEPGQRIVLKKKENWWGDKISNAPSTLQAYPDQLVYKPIGNATTALSALKAEEIDVMHNIETAAFLDLQEDEYVNERFELYTPSSMAYYFISVNSENPKLQDVKVREAIAHAVNVDEMLDNVFQGFGKRVASPVPVWSDDYNTTLEPVPFNIDEARRLLKEAGWEDSNNNGIVDKEIEGEQVELSLTYIHSAGRETSQNIALLIQDNARRAGIEIIPTPREGAVLLDSWRKKNYELVSAGRALAPNWNPKQNYHTQSDNRNGFGTAETDAMIDEILSTQDAERKAELLNQLQEEIARSFTEIFLFSPTGRVAIHKRFKAEVSPMLPGYQPAYFEMK